MGPPAPAGGLRRTRSCPTFPAKVQPAVEVARQLLHRHESLLLGRGRNALQGELPDLREVREVDPLELLVGVAERPEEHPGHPASHLDLPMVRPPSGSARIAGTPPAFPR